MNITTRWTAQDAAKFLSPPIATDHKYRRGVLGLRTGSPAYPGAAVLGAEAAWRTGIGMVQYVPQADAAKTEFGLPTPAAAVLAARPETIVSQTANKVSAWLVGSGTDPADRPGLETAAIHALLQDSRPVVADAGALNLCAQQLPRVAPLALTPHAGEFAALWRALGQDQPADDITACVSLAQALDCTIALKGSVTHVASPEGTLLSIGPATPWLATAGTGDVLAGIFGALAARHATSITSTGPEFAELAATAALLHDTAARLAAGPSTHGRPITALDVADHISAAIEQIMA